MNIFAATKTLAFVNKLFAAAKLNLDEFVAAGDESALQAHIAAQSTGAAPADTAAKDTEIANLKTQLANSNTANSDHATRHSAIVTTLSAAGVKFSAADKPETLAPALEARISTRAGEELAKRGLRDFPAQTVEADPTKVAAKVDQKLTGLARTRAAFKARIDASRN